MATTSELLAFEAALEKALASGIQTVRHGERYLQYRSASELKSALFDVKKQLRSAPVITDVRFSTSKGF